MKKSTIISALAVVMASAASAQKINASKVPAAVKAAFVKQYPGTTVKWENENGKYEAGFKQAGTEMSILYDANGIIMESEMAIKLTDLPSAALIYVKEHYKGKGIKEAAKITLANGDVNYEAEVAGKDIIFDTAGNFLREVKD